MSNRRMSSKPPDGRHPQHGHRARPCRDKPPGIRRHAQGPAADPTREPPKRCRSARRAQGHSDATLVHPKSRCSLEAEQVAPTRSTRPRAGLAIHIRLNRPDGRVELGRHRERLPLWRPCPHQRRLATSHRHRHLSRASSAHILPEPALRAVCGGEECTLVERRISGLIRTCATPKMVPRGGLEPPCP